MDALQISALNEYTAHVDPDEMVVAELAASMRVAGWQGAPVLTHHGVYAVTGTHRIEAARITDTEVPTLDVSEVTDDDLFGLDGIAARHGLDDLTAARVGFALAWSDEEIAWYGLDVQDIEGIVYEMTGRAL